MLTIFPSFIKRFAITTAFVNSPPVFPRKSRIILYDFSSFFNALTKSEDVFVPIKLVTLI